MHGTNHKATRKCGPESQKSYKKAKLDSSSTCSSSDNEGELTISSISGQICRSISKRVKKQPNEKLKNVQENNIS